MVEATLKLELAILKMLCTILKVMFTSIYIFEFIRVVF